MPANYDFSNSEMSRFAHEPERRADRSGAATVAPQKAAAPKEAKRSAPNPRDMSLTTLAQAWCARLPQDQRPHALCEAYPRIANRLAICWGDPVLTAMVFKDLLTDRRSGRKGFPAAVQRELVALRDAANPGARTSA